MKLKTKGTLLAFLILLAFPGKSQSDKEIVEAYNQLSLNPSLENQFAYFKAFPSTFEKFNQLFGYKETGTNVEFGPLYKVYSSFIQAFFDLPDIGVNSFLEKVISISIGGKWQADAVNMFQHNMREVVLQYHDLAVPILLKRSDKEIEAFYFFFFHSIHLRYKTVPTELSSNNSRIQKAQQEGLERAKKESGH